LNLIIWTLGDALVARLQLPLRTLKTARAAGLRRPFGTLFETLPGVGDNATRISARRRADARAFPFSHHGVVEAVLAIDANEAVGRLLFQFPFGAIALPNALPGELHAALWALRMAIEQAIP